MEDKLRQELKTAQLAKDEVKVSTLRLLISEINNLKIAKGSELTEEDFTSVVKKEVKKRKEAAQAFHSGGREESAQKEEAELKILEDYLPAQMSNEELTKIVDTTINELGAASLSDIGRVIGAVMSKSGGQVDGSVVSSLVREKLKK